MGEKVVDIKLRVERKDGWDYIYYSGPMNEDLGVRLIKLYNGLGPKCVFNFRDVEFINSGGIKGWLSFMRMFQEGRTIVFEECSPEVLLQINMIPSFRGNAQVKSVYASYRCAKCATRARELFELTRNLPKPGEPFPQKKCEKCQGIMHMEQEEEEFYALHSLTNG